MSKMEVVDDAEMGAVKMMEGDDGEMDVMV